MKGTTINSTKKTFESIDAYIASFPADTQSMLAALREIVRTAAPDAQEKISYNMPTFAQNGTIIHFAAWKKHIGLYAASHAVLQALKDEVAPFVTEKGTLQFPLNQPLPADLITKIVQMRLAENLKEES